LHVAYQGSQLDFAVRYLRSHPRTRLVTLTVGANDLFICQATTVDRCTGPDFADAVAEVERNVDTILSTLRERAHYHHRLVLIDYYSLDYRDPAGTASVRLLDAALARAARANSAIVADGFAAFRAGSATAGGDTCAARLIIALPTGGCDVHPTRRGHGLLADAVLRAAGH
jgi:lysophospholipase L1-like esterase